MKISLTFLTVGLAALVAAAGPAFAGDWNNGAGGLKGSYGSAAVPVPAPIGIPETRAEWYLRADIGIGLGKNGTIGSGSTDLGLLHSFSDQGSNGIIKLGFGRYVTPTLRAEFAVDLRNQQKVAKDQRATYTQTDSRTGLIAPGVVTTSTYQFDRDQSLTSANQTGMVTLYQDIGNWHGFKPYISGGAGIAIRTSKYEHAETGKCVGTVDSNGVSYASCNSPVTPYSSSHGVNNGYGVALAVGTGFGYAIKQGVTLDMGYRYLWQAQPMSISTQAGLGTTVIKFDTRGEHELTTGLRFDID